METVDFKQMSQPQSNNPSAMISKIPLLAGEERLQINRTVDGESMVTNFRFCVCERRSFINVPLMMVAELFVLEAARRLRIGCKDGSTYSCTFASAEDCSQCVCLLREKTGPPASRKALFAYKFYTAATLKDNPSMKLLPEEVQQLRLCKPVTDIPPYSLDAEIKRLGFDTNQRKIWRITQANQKYEYCPTYPREHILPATYDDEKLKGSLEFRAMRRFPSVVWRDKTSGVVIIRSSQPLSSFLGISFGYFQNQQDVCLMEEIVNACNRDREMLLETLPGLPMLEHDLSGLSRGGNLYMDNGQLLSNQSEFSSLNTEDDDDLRTTRKLAIVDCRSLAGVWGNSFKGGGTEDEVVYKCNIIHLDLANIHTVRDSFNKLRALCHTYVEGSFLKNLSGCMWLSYISALLRGANIVVELIHNKKRPVLVHCSDGWDRTAQIVSLSEIMLDPYYRTFDGFQVVVEREWIHFGHKFGERGGHDPNCSDSNQISPIFLQFLDCVYQLTIQYPADFQFNEAYLIKLLKHSQACLFGNFLHNCQKEREVYGQKTASVWSLLKSDNIQLVNLLYKPSQKVLIARFSEHDVALWKSVYMAGLSPLPHTDFYLESSVSAGGSDEEGGAVETLPRSKSMDDLSKIASDSGRRNSVPSIAQCPDVAALTSGLDGFMDTPMEQFTVEEKSREDGSIKSNAVMPLDSGNSIVVQLEVDSIPSQVSTPHENELHQTSLTLENGDGRRDNFSISAVENDTLTIASINECQLVSNSILTLETLNGHVMETTCHNDNSLNHIKYKNDIKLVSSKSIPNGICLEPIENRHKDIKSCSKVLDFSHESLCKNCVSESNFRHVSSLPEHLAWHHENELCVNGHRVEHINNKLNHSQQTLCHNHQHSSTEDIHLKHCMNGECVSELLNNKLVADLIYCNGISGKPESGAAKLELSIQEERTHINSDSTDTLIGDMEIKGDIHHSTADFLSCKVLDMNVKQIPTVQMTKDECIDLVGLNSGAHLISRQARAASGASRDVSISPRERRNNLTEAGRLRHSSGNDSINRRWLSSSVSTSTTDLTDSYVKRYKWMGPSLEKLSNLKYHHIDIDGLTMYCDEKQELLIEQTLDKERKINELETRLQYALNLLKRQPQTQSSLFLDDNIVSDSDGGELCSLGSYGNPASDASWENIDESESKLTLWVPDTAVTHCADCGDKFWACNRKHHCRNCGKIFCASCSSYTCSVPDQQLHKPERVCRKCYSCISQLSPGASSDGRIPALVADG